MRTHILALPLYPFLIALYSPLALASANVDNGVTASDLGLPLALCALFAMTGWLAGRIVTPDMHKSALIAALIVLLLLSGGWVDELIGEVAGSATTATAPWSAGLLLLTAATATQLIRRTTRVLASATRFLNTAASLLVGFALISGAGTVMFKLANQASAPTTQRHGYIADTTLPDIYYIILDSYSSGRTLRAQYAHDNSTFERRLEDRGFFVPSRARANYVSTYLALAAALNWTYLDNLSVDPGVSSRDRSIPYRMIEDSRAWRVLREHGYKLVFLPTSYKATEANQNADVVLSQRQSNEFMVTWFSGTALSLAMRLLCTRAASCGESELPFAPEGAESIRWKLSRMAHVPSIAGPKLTIAHIMAPHEPFVFHGDCTARDPFWPKDASQDAEWREAYAEQVTCINRLLLPLVDSLIARSTRPPVIVLQGDHGHGRFPLGRAPSLTSVTKEQVEDRTHIFAAYYLPGAPPEAFYDSISPVNIWPVVLSQYFARPTALLPDRTYWSSADRPYTFTQLH